MYSSILQIWWGIWGDTAGQQHAGKVPQSCASGWWDFLRDAEVVKVERLDPVGRRFQFIAKHIRVEEATAHPHGRDKSTRRAATPHH